MPSRIFLALSLLFCGGITAEPRAVMLFLSARDQPDSLGYNLVSELPAVLYEDIAAGTLPLWDSPEKHFRIQPSSLKSIEQANNVSLLSTPQLFILEKWTMDNNGLTTEIAGFYFTDRTPAGKEISYGYVDYSDAEMALTAESIQAGANGNCFTTFKYILLNHLYFYNIVQYGRRKVSSVEESQKLKREIAKDLPGQVQPLTPVKKVVYLVSRTAPAGKESNGRTQQANKTLDLVEKFLNANRELFFNLGGERTTGFVNDKTLRVQALEAEEIWTRNDTGYDSQLLSLVVRMDSGALDPMTQEELWKLRIQTDESDLATLLKQKEFYFRILAINADRIAPEDSDKYRKALETYAWNRVREYVRSE